MNDERHSTARPFATLTTISLGLLASAALALTVGCNGTDMGTLEEQDLPEPKQPEWNYKQPESPQAPDPNPSAGGTMGNPNDGAPYGAPADEPAGDLTDGQSQR
ncbi:hypothetical protein [Halochromatium salexigens]|uniref:Lipoprotein n=1 Tax=Halochromatium salexigens TaxID=49447 RepID=A0AAJ0UDK3_HALSE|nr:hypothetical protein [Halochromatium salexigens]MBK5929501.1 hypothetical protein [Halochromatium salexigens]